MFGKKKDSGKALDMMRNMIGDKPLNEKILAMFLKNAPENDSGQKLAKELYLKTGEYCVEHGITFNDWYNAVTYGKFNDGTTPDDIPNMCGEQIFMEMRRNIPKSNVDDNAQEK